MNKREYAGLSRALKAIGTIAFASGAFMESWELATVGYCIVSSAWLCAMLSA